MGSGVPIRTIVSNLGVYGLAHAVVDATCAAMLFSVPVSYNTGNIDFYFLVITYNVFAFGLQPFFGRLTDLWQAPRWSAIAGCGMVAVSVFGLNLSPVLSICVAGIGNALFHVGGGSVSLNLTPGKAAAPGIFVAPGALGLATGIVMGREGYFVPSAFVMALGISCLGMFALKNVRIDYNRASPGCHFPYFVLVLLLLLASISIRSLIGMGVEFSWKTNAPLLAILTLSVVGGKAVGGLLADRYGWVAVSVTALATSAPLVAFGGNAPYVGILGMFLFNMTMAVTLVAIAGMFPGRPGFGFGLPCLALLIGAFPAFTEFRSFLADPWLVLFIIFGSAGILLVGLNSIGLQRNGMIHSTILSFFSIRRKWPLAQSSQISPAKRHANHHTFL